MADVASEADRLHEAGRNKIVRTLFLYGIPLLVILVVAALQRAGAIRLEEYFWEDPEKADPQLMWLLLGVFGLLQVLILAIGVYQGWACMRRAQQLR